MLLQALGILAISGLSGFASAQSYPNGSSSESDVVAVKWIGDTPALNSGTTFGLPWPRGKYQANETTFAGLGGDGDTQIPLQSWVTAYWPDGSIKWSGHAIGGSDTVYDEYKVTASTTGPSNSSSASGLIISDSDEEVSVDTGKVTATFPKSGNVLVSAITTSSGKVVGQNGRLILRSQSGIEDEADANATSISKFKFESSINETTVEFDQDNSVRALVTVRGTHQATSGTHGDLLPFIVRFYLYADSDAIRIVHTLVFDGKADEDFVSGIGVQFDVPLAGEELYNRHIRLAGPDGGLLREAVQGITGLRRDPGEAVRTAQFNGEETPDIATWDTRVSSRMQWIPAWNDYSLTQLSPDGFTLKKRTKAGQSWVKIPGGTQSGGLAYLGGATQGGLAVALRDFWKRYPTSLDISNAAADAGQITLWLYSPSAEPMDLRPFHDGLGEDTYDEQLDALEITYEDYEGGYDTPYGVARTNEIYLFPFDSTPSADTLAELTRYANEPPALAADPAYIQQTKAVGSYWATIPDNSTAAAQTIESHLNFLITYYQDQVSQRRWYGFWDHGDIMHTYDTDRHTWRYDIGGYAWDNSELSPNLFFWNYFLRTGRADVYRFAEAHARHTGEVDVYHIGPFKGFGTRHGVQHWGDSSKQIRVSTPIYRQVFYYLSGGDERVGELLHELMDAEQAFLTVDPRRKVRDDNGTYVIDPTALDLDLGLDWSGLASTWLIEWERRGPRWEEARSKLNVTMHSIANLTNGFVTGLGLYNLHTGVISPPATDPQNLGNVTVSHLSASFGLPEIISQLADYLGDDLPPAFESAWLDYCYYYGAGSAEQAARYGVGFGSLSLRQGHSRLTAYAAAKLGNATLAARAWNEFLNTDGFAPSLPWASEPVNGSQVLVPVDEASWVATNDAALYGLAAIENLAQVGWALG
ncbi:hypothetical protein F4821DRAFT_163865 [Hypoxylon rubiginosum]|uniref:Uncharacterized protein n=1 Tax=Hypoxylon rubiginosum TaxID=110542 RepID=A0ACC0CX82_9PEZI|nr:hypothetical protein F4821DRAFT_163865 [Hypoxylon rubiginosum]